MHRTKFNDPHGTLPSVTIATALASVENTPPYETDFSLADEIDPDTLDELLTNGPEDVEVTFTIEDYRVIAHGDGMVKIQVRGNSARKV